MFNESATLFGTCDPVFHRKRREAMNPLFSRRAILKLESSIREKGERLIQVIALYKDGPVPVDLYSAFRSMTLDVIYDYIYGEDAGAIAYPSFKHAILANTEAVNQAGGVQRHLSIIVGRSLESRATEFHERKAKVQQSGERVTVLSRIVELENPSWHSLVEESQTLTFAGSDTGMEIRKKALEELSSVCPDSNMSISYEILEKLPYLTAIIKESLRLSHGVPVGLLREVQPTSAWIGGYEIPRGAIVSMGATFMHWNDKVFPDPHRFSPERWLQDQTKELDSYLVPFSRGPRQCIGMNLAWCEMYIILGNLFRRLDIEIQDMSVEDMRDIRFHFVAVLAGKRHLWGAVKDLVA
ncbi:hypothetical protein D9758_009718 [Tetrapyrgos nigripes]|uniref:Cytochrome P450 n=1 Tax=Tetrapyrgos nigripes TaxID=182062 RepID=A0A8H5CNN9_9AGAR|nr:hypothetical protein D9758_009718 [Tetrapyrgos nigripes]